MRLVLLFIDGVGVGAKEPSINPLARREHLLSWFRATDADGTSGGAILRPDFGPDARLYTAETTFGVSGRPQSASNQTALLTGLPAPRLVGGHVLGFPNIALRALLAENAFVARLTARGEKATFANGFPRFYLEALGLPFDETAESDGQVPSERLRKIKPSASTCAFIASGVPFRTFTHVRRDEALTHDVVNRRGREHGFQLPERTPEEAADILWRLAEGQAFTLFEHFLADEAGHARDFDAALHALDAFDAFARSVIQKRPSDAAVVICSDHGNVEDLSLRNHTPNPVPVLWFGAGAPEPEALVDLSDVGKAMARALGVPAETTSAATGARS